MRHALVFSLAMIGMLLTGCGDITRAEYERANEGRHTKLVEIPLDNGDTRVVYGGSNPQIDPNTGAYTNPSGCRVVTYRGTTDGGTIVARWWQDDEPLLP